MKSALKYWEQRTGDGFYQLKTSEERIVQWFFCSLWANTLCPPERPYTVHHRCLSERCIPVAAASRSPGLLLLRRPPLKSTHATSSQLQRAAVQMHPGDGQHSYSSPEISQQVTDMMPVWVLPGQKERSSTAASGWQTSSSSGWLFPAVQ